MEVKFCHLALAPSVLSGMWKRWGSGVSGRCWVTHSGARGWVNGRLFWWEEAEAGEGGTASR